MQCLSIRSICDFIDRYGNRFQLLLQILLSSHTERKVGFFCFYKVGEIPKAGVRSVR